MIDIDECVRKGERQADRESTFRRVQASTYSMIINKSWPLHDVQPLLTSHHAVCSTGRDRLKGADLPPPVPSRMYQVSTGLHTYLARLQMPQSLDLAKTVSPSLSLSLDLCAHWKGGLRNKEKRSTGGGKGQVNACWEVLCTNEYLHETSLNLLFKED